MRTEGGGVLAWILSANEVTLDLHLCLTGSLSEKGGLS